MGLIVAELPEARSGNGCHLLHDHCRNVAVWLQPFRSLVSARRIRQDHFSRAGNHRLDSRRWNHDRLVSELPNGDDHAENAGAVSNRFESAAAFFFRADEESISRFLVILHKRLVWLRVPPYATIVPTDFR